MEKFLKTMQENEIATIILFVAIFWLLCGIEALVYGVIAITLYTVFCFIMTYGDDDDDWFSPFSDEGKPA